MGRYVDRFDYVTTVSVMAPGEAAGMLSNEAQHTNERDRAVYPVVLLLWVD